MTSALPTIQDTFGALYVGAILAAVLFGITNLQAVMYYKRYPDDWWLYRYSTGRDALVRSFIRLSGGWRLTCDRILDTLHVALSTYALYVFLIDMYGDLLRALETTVRSMQLQLSVNDMLVVFVQWVYAIRLWKRSGTPFSQNSPTLCRKHPNKFSRVLHPLITSQFVTVTASLGAGIFIVYDIFHVPNLASASIIKRSIYTYCSTIAAADFIIAAMMCYYLHKSRGVTMISSTSATLLRLMRLILISGLATSACSLFTLIAYIVWPESLIFLGIHFVLSKLYVNSLLAMLNYRREHKSNKAKSDYEVNSTLRIAPQSSQATPEESAIMPPQYSINSVVRDRYALHNVSLFSIQNRDRKRKHRRSEVPPKHRGSSKSGKKFNSPFPSQTTTTAHEDDCSTMKELWGHSILQWNISGCAFSGVVKGLSS
ncbi:uncharacterized protein BT62DRAFT_1014189 [Guyanagaster necrorhizus]|uniref:DUF6534 domain-containing protein n=1 Tax=Guyanagaster necrorhizus TaxID=856835 RepID=A0A9P7VEI2_9AGAR|nr:uncharacterized protein BT62DRAFT_1014189 [Guyanagaster necrorhizus MCA 3950]KAG7439239.1 hypothetical protein BT62DRAFT_1014189 [Guyanagaster necrorhizus MCA 3950]